MFFATIKIGIIANGDWHEHRDFGGIVHIVTCEFLAVPKIGGETFLNPFTHRIGRNFAKRDEWIERLLLKNGARYFEVIEESQIGHDFEVGHKIADARAYTRLVVLVLKYPKRNIVHRKI